jgi:ribonuclease BN (tRNA processing enzyme)
MGEPMTDVRILPLGVGDAFTARHYTTCLALGAGDDWLLVDCPHPVRKMLREASHAAALPLDLDNIVGVALSHLHADHVSGLEDFTFYRYYKLGRRTALLAHPEVTAKLWSGTLAGGMSEVREAPGAPLVTQRFDDYFELTDLSTDRPVTFGPFQLECRFTRHLIPTTAFRITVHGRVLGFSADTSFDPDLIDWLAPADLIVHEVTHLPSSSVHTPYARLTALPEALRTRLRLIHYPDEFDPDASGIEALRQGRIYAV